MRRLTTILVLGCSGLADAGEPLAARHGRPGATAESASPAPDSARPDFSDLVAPLLARHCLECHRGAAAEGSLDLATREGVLRGGDSGAAVVAGDPTTSLLLSRVAADEMPPGRPLAADEKRLLEEWIRAGAPWEGREIDPFIVSTPRRAGYDWWSLEPLGPVEVPAVAAADAGWPLNEIDRFVLARLRAAGLGPAATADPRTLVRRLFVDLTGLPPAPEAIDRFAADPSPQAWERLIDELLASRAYAERQARHWLDVVRFGESDGYEHNRPRDAAWPYRDWVIRAFAADLPYAEFVRLQLAGDVLAADAAEGAAASGFLVAGVHNTVLGASPAMREAARQDELEDLCGTVAQAFLGLTVNCARCHDHKFDPVSTEEYYRFAAAFAGVGHGIRTVPDAAGGELPIYTCVSIEPGPTRVLLRGDVARPGGEVTPGGLRAVRGATAEFGLPPEASDADRRRRLAEWITAPGNGTLWRVIVNRVWQQHFGRGIVETPSDFGFNGGRPSHPKLLDWLAARLRDDGGSLKRLHRLVCMSATYRQAAAGAGGGREDVDNRLLWRQNPRRIEAEVLRDAALAVAGVLDSEPFGPGYRDVRIEEVPPTFYYLPTDAAGPGSDRRTVYRWSPRGQRGPLLDTFDCPDPSTPTPRRGVTTTPTQALAQWNDAFIVRTAERMAARVAAEVPTPAAGPRVDRAWRLALGRLPTPAERPAAVALVEEHGLPLLCRVLFNTGEFTVID